MSAQLVVASLLGWLQREQSEAIGYLREETRILKTQLGNRRLRLTDDERRRLANVGARLGRQRLMQVATIVTPYHPAVAPSADRTEMDLLKPPARTTRRPR